ncbi:hypothetical protein KA107_01295 [Candidatus Pacearchaeota archaeon]|nr:hypothetical protein [Candidatus Pacearchaeota archaeon]
MKKQTYGILAKLAFNLSLVGFLALILSYFSILSLEVVISENLLLGISLAFLFLYFVFAKNMDRTNIFIESVYSISKYIFLVLLLVLTVNQFWKNPVIALRILPLSIFSVFFGALTFYRNSDKVEKEIENDRQTEQNLESKRLLEFDSKFRRLAWFNFSYGVGSAWKEGKYLKFLFRVLISPLVWFVRLPYSFVKWMYKEGWGHSIGLIAILFYGSFLILSNLGLNDIYADEQWNLQVIKSLDAGQGFHLWNYITQQPMMSETNGRISEILSFLFFKLLGETNFYLRLPGALFGILNILLVYLIFKRLTTKPLSLLIAAGFMLNINALYLARFMRPYTISLSFYLLSFIFLIVFLEYLFKNKYLSTSNLMLFFLCFVSFLISIEEREIGKMLLVVIPLSIILVFILNTKLTSQIFKLNKIPILYILFVISGIVLGLYLFKIVNLFSIIEQFFRYISINKFNDPSWVYLNYLFVKWIRTPSLFIILASLGLFYLIYIIIKIKRISMIVLFTFTFFPILIMVYFFNLYEDPRYIYFLTPFIYVLFGLGCAVLLSLFFPHSKNKGLVILGIILFVNVFLVLPYSGGGTIFLKSPSIWNVEDAKMLWHFRAAVPEYNTAYTYLNQNQQRGDAVIVLDGINNLVKLDNVSYYGIDVWNYSREIYNYKSFNMTGWSKKDYVPEDFFSLINRSSGKRIWVIGAYVIMLDKKMSNYLLSKCDNMASQLEIKKFNMWYDASYQNKLYWPNVYLCNL